MVVSWSVNVFFFLFMEYFSHRSRAEISKKKGNSKTYTYRRVAVTPFAPYSLPKNIPPMSMETLYRYVQDTQADRCSPVRGGLVCSVCLEALLNVLQVQGGCEFFRDFHKNDTQLWPYNKMRKSDWLKRGSQYR